MGIDLYRGMGPANPHSAPRFLWRNRDFANRTSRGDKKATAVGQNVLETKWLSGKARRFSKSYAVEIKRLAIFSRRMRRKKGERFFERIIQNVFENKRDAKLTLIKFTPRPECYRKINHLSPRGQNVFERKGVRRKFNTLDALGERGNRMTEGAPRSADCGGERATPQ